MIRRSIAGTLALWTLLLWVEPASAQMRAFADIGATMFTASQSFETVLGSSAGVVFGGGAEGTIWRDIVVGVRVSRFRKSGQRVFVFEGQRFDLGIPATITVTPLELTGAYRMIRRGWQVVPYAGGGVGWHRYEEASSFAEVGEDVHRWFTGYHLVGGLEFRLSQWIGVAGEAQWATVPNALGGDANGVSHEFQETDLGGSTFRVKVVVGR